MAKVPSVNAAAFARQYSDLFDKHSKLREKDRMEELEFNDLDIGDLLGKGSFCSVYKVNVPKLGCSDSPKLRRRSLLSNCIVNHHKVGHNSKEYAIKMMKRSNKAKSDFDKKLCVFARCMVIEAKLLSFLNHENIIKLHGIKGGCLATSFQRGDFFLVLQRVYDTLDNRLSAWRELRQKDETKKLVGRLLNKKGNAVPSLSNRVETVARGISRALEYLHENNVLYRDLKPQNIGFDEDGKVILFDFGISQELDPGLCSTTCRGGRKLTQRVGTLRYIAPENYNLSQDYGFPSDVYSFGMLLWAISTCELPFDEYSAKEMKSIVIGSNLRPSLQKACFDKSPRLAELISSCWDTLPRRRPTFRAVNKALSEDILANNNSPSFKQ